MQQRFPKSEFFRSDDNLSGPGLRETIAVVAIVVTASKADALKELLHHLPADSGASFFVIHQSVTNHAAFSSDVLCAWTSMACFPISDGMTIEPNHVYITPLQRGVTIRAGKLFVIDLPADVDAPLPLDHFLYELSDSFGSRAVCVFLSRDGLDGMRGTDALHLANGFVITPSVHPLTPDDQSIETIETIAQPHIEWAPSIEVTASRILEYIQFLDIPTPESMADDQAMLFSMLRQATGIDFTLYKQTSVLRRIHRQMQVKDITSLREYTRLLHDHPQELEDLKQTLLIGATYFFRDPDAFSFIADKIIPTLIAERGEGQQIRVWVAGCSTGEEVYSLAILLRQALRDEAEEVDVKIFATDADPVSIQFASRGLYPDSIAQSVSQKHLAHYFTRIGPRFQIRKEIRDMIVFAQHNLLRDPPFSQMDLVVCRNLLIYLKPESQQKVLSLFVFALRPYAFLFLGPSETLGEMSRSFHVLDSRWNVFRKTEVHRLSASAPFGVATPLSSRSLYQSDRIAARIKQADQMQKMDSVYSRLIEDYMDAFILVDEKDEVLHVNGLARDYMEIPSGKPSNNLFKMLPEYLAILLRTALHKAREEHRDIAYSDIVFRQGARQHAFNMNVRPLRVARQALFVIFFHPVAEPGERLVRMMDRTAGDSDFLIISDEVAEHIKDLEQALTAVKENLQSTTEELDDSNEEFQAINEELIVSNEELQSTNEELQAVNEELMAMNIESQRQIQALTELNDDINNLFVSTNIGTLFLDSRMRLRKFTPAIALEFNVIASDIGRSFGDISHKLDYAELLPDIEMVLLSGRPMERDVESQSGKWYTAKVLPYCAAGGILQGVVLTLTDITGLKQVTEELLILSYAISQSPGCILITDTQRRITYVNLKYSEQTQFSLEELAHTRLELYSDKVSLVELENIWTRLASGTPWFGELVNRKKDGDTFREAASLLPIRNRDGEIAHYLKISEDLTEQNKTIELLQRSELLSAVGQLAAGIAHEIRNPLTVLKGFIQLIAPELSNQHYTNIMISEFTRIETIINELLLLSRPHETHFETHNLQHILQDVIALLESQANLNNVRIATDYSEPVPYVDGVQNHLKQVFINVLKNGIEAMPRGGLFSIQVSWNSPDRVTLRFSDEGEGIPDDLLPRLGTPFFTTKPNGTGLGLLVTAKIIENHQGKIDIASEVGRGTTVEIVLNASPEPTSCQTQT